MSSKNVGPMDAGVRALLGVVMLGVAASFNTRPLLAVAAGFVAVIFLATALFRICPLYALVGITTCPRDTQPR